MNSDSRLIVIRIFSIFITFLFISNFNFIDFNLNATGSNSDDVDIIVFAPHPDDELLGCGGIIESSIDSGKNVKVVIMTNGDGYDEACIRYFGKYGIEHYDDSSDVKESTRAGYNKGVLLSESYIFGGSASYEIPVPDGLHKAKIKIHHFETGSVNDGLNVYIYDWDALIFHWDYVGTTGNSGDEYWSSPSEINLDNYVKDGIIRVKISANFYDQSDIHWVTIAEYDSDNLNSEYYYKTLGKARITESKNAMKKLGLDPEKDITFLGFPDAGLNDLLINNWDYNNLYTSKYTESDHSYAGTYINTPYCGNAVLDKIKNLMINYQPTTIYIPHALDTHKDHSSTNYFVTGALKNLEKNGNSWATNIKIKSYLVHWDHQNPWPEPRHEDVYKNLEDVIRSPEDLDYDEEFTLGDYIDIKFSTLQCYSSQINVDKEYLFSFVRKNEIFWKDTISWKIDKYHSYDEVRVELFRLKAGFGDFIELKDLGDTYENRDIWAIKISDNPTKEESSERDILYMAAHHAREKITVEAAMYWIHYLTNNYEKINEATEIIEENEIWVVPLVNPDGHHIALNYESEWRKNIRDNNGNGYVDYPICHITKGTAWPDGVDLNRNYGFHWGDDIDPLSDNDMSHDPDLQTYAGPYLTDDGIDNDEDGSIDEAGEGGFSEPETQAIRDLVVDTKYNFVSSLSWHSYATPGLIIYPWGYTNSKPKDESKFIDMASKMKQTGYKTDQSYNEPYPTSGNSDDWFYSKGIFSFTVEIKGSSFNPPLNDIKGHCEDNRKIALALAQESKTLLPGGGTPKIIKDGSVSISLASFADLHLYDPLGNHIGPNETKGISNGSYEYSSSDIQYINLSRVIEGVYYIEVIGTGNGPYNLTINGYDNQNITFTKSYNSNISKGDIHGYFMDLSKKDGKLNIVTSDLKANPKDKLPVADAGGDRYGFEGTPIHFDGSGSYDPDGRIILYEWDFTEDGITDAYGINPSYTWYDDYTGTFTLTITSETILTVVDDKGNSYTYTIIEKSSKSNSVFVENVPPTPSIDRAYMYVDFTLRGAGEKYHNIFWDLYETDWEEDGGPIGESKLIAHLEVERYPGDPDKQSDTVSDVYLDMENIYYFVATYYPYEDDMPINGQPWGSNPTWVTLTFEDGSTEQLHHNFNVQQSIKRDSEHWVHVEPWNIDLSPYFVDHEITFDVSATDPGSDDENFDMDWDDATSHNIKDYWFRSSGTKDPLPSPYDQGEGNYPIDIHDSYYHTYTQEDDYFPDLTVTDDDKGLDSFEIDIDAIHTQHIYPIK